MPRAFCIAAICENAHALSVCSYWLRSPHKYDTPTCGNSRAPANRIGAACSFAALRSTAGERAAAGCSR